MALNRTKCSFSLPNSICCLFKEPRHNSLVIAAVGIARRTALEYSANYAAASAADRNIMRDARHFVDSRMRFLAPPVAGDLPLVRAP
jgi:hypothetical protein